MCKKGEVIFLHNYITEHIRTIRDIEVVSRSYNYYLWNEEFSAFVELFRNSE